MVDKMGFFNFFLGRNKKNRNSFFERWVWMENGLIRDLLRENQPAWIVATNLFESWIQGVEERCNQSLGRRLAHAANQSDEALIPRNLKLNILTRKSSIDWDELNVDWKHRGLGELSLLDNSEENLSLLISFPANEAMCAGFASAAIERYSGTRYRFRWNGTREQSVVVRFTEDKIEIPTVQVLDVDWLDGDSNVIELEDFKFFENDDYGRISFMGNRSIFLHRDLIIRFIQFCEPYVEELFSGHINQYDFSGLSKSDQLIWTAMADSLREATFNMGFHVMISKSDDWLNVGSRFLSDSGLGSIESVTLIDEHGGVEFILNGCFHPALAGGVLLSCWERAYGCRGCLKCNMKGGIVHLIISSSVELSN